jgi:hypothetical protein
MGKDLVPAAALCGLGQGQNLSEPPGSPGAGGGEMRRGEACSRRLRRQAEDKEPRLIEPSLWAGTEPGISAAQRSQQPFLADEENGAQRV